MNVLENFKQVVPEEYKKSQFVYLANNDQEQNTKARQHTTAQDRTRHKKTKVKDQIQPKRPVTQQVKYRENDSRTCHPV